MSLHEMWRSDGTDHDNDSIGSLCGEMGWLIYRYSRRKRGRERERARKSHPPFARQFVCKARSLVGRLTLRTLYSALSLRDTAASLMGEGSRSHNKPPRGEVEITHFHAQPARPAKSRVDHSCPAGWAPGMRPTPTILDKRRI